MSAAATQAVRTAEVRLVPLPMLHESPTNRRRTWGKLEELAASMGGGTGILEPLLGRPHPSKEGHVELVFGHRRLRAAKIARLDVAPCLVRELTDDQVLDAQAIENLQRQDIHPIEEAETFELLRDRQRLSVEDLGAKVGKSTSYVYARLKLLDLVQAARAAFVDGALSPSVALLVARVPAAMQEDALAELRKIADGWKHEDGTPVSFREASDALEERYTLELAHAPFDRKDLTLVPGAPACADCPKRSGNQKGLFEAVGGDPLPADVCTDPTCFALKRKASADRTAEKLEAKGISVVTGKRSKFGGVRPPRGFVLANGYLAGKPVEQLLAKARSKEPRTPSLKSLAAKTMMIGESGKPVEVVREEDLRAALNLTAPKEPAWKEQHAKRELEDKIRAAAETRLFTAVVAKIDALEGVPTKALLRLLVGQAMRTCPDDRVVGARRGWKGDRARGGYEKEIAQLDETRLLGLLAEAILSGDGWDFAKDYAATAKLFGVDLTAVWKAAKEEITKEAPDKPEAEPATKKGKATKGRGGANQANKARKVS